jgi:predicted dehydrogenase
MIRVGIAGAGTMGKQHYLAYSLLGDARVTAIADQREEKVKSIAGSSDCMIYTDIETMLASDDVDVVDLCLPTSMHKQYTIAAANRGKHILCEKPIALKREDARAMIDACQKNRVSLAVGHCLRFSGEYLLLKDMIDTGRYGDLLSLRLFRHSAVPRWSENNWLENPAESGGAALDLHIHDVDMLLFLLGIPRSVLSRGSLNQLATLYEYENLSLAVTVESSWQFPAQLPFRAGYDAVFQKASLSCDLDRVLLYENDREPVVKKAKDFMEDPGFPKDGSMDLSVYLYYLEIQYFIRCILESKDPTRLSPENAVDALLVTLLEMEQLKTGKFHPRSCREFLSDDIHTRKTEDIL